MAKFDIHVNVLINARENSCKIGRAPYGVRLIFYNAGTGRCFHMQTPDGARTICDHARENSLKSSGARAIIKFAGDVHIAEIVRCQFYL